MDCVVAPVDQRYDAPALAESVTEPPVQNVVGALAVTVGVEATVTGIVVESLAEHPPAATVTPSVMLPVGPATKLRVGVPWPPLIVPPVIVQV